MGNPQTKYHAHKEKWQAFEEDFKEFSMNYNKYSGIRERPESYGWCYHSKGKTIKTCRRLSEIYEFKIKYEAENER